MQVMLGVGEQHRALDQLAKLVTSDRHGVPLEEIDRALGLFETVAPTAADAFRGDRLQLGMFVTRPWGDHPAVIARGVNTIDFVLREAERAAGTNDRAEIDRIAALAQSESSWTNPIAATVLPSCGSVLLVGVELRARYSLVHAAIALERARDADGRFPASPELPLDPLAAGERLHYRLAPNARGYALWSVGRNGKDDGGRSVSPDADDILVEHLSVDGPR